MTDGITISDVGDVQFRAYGAGTLQTDASGNVTASSDAALKEQVEPYHKGLTALKAIKPMSFKWRKDTGLDTRRRYYGFIAQNVEESIPEAVDGKEGTKSLQDRTLIATLVNAVNELSHEVERLKEKIL